MRGIKSLPTTKYYGHEGTNRYYCDFCGPGTRAMGSIGNRLRTTYMCRKHWLMVLATVKEIESQYTSDEKRKRAKEAL